MEVTDRASRQTRLASTRRGRVQHVGSRRSPARPGEGGFTLVEVVMTMVLLSVGIMSLAPVMLAVFQGNRFAQNMSLATSLAEDRLEQVLNDPLYENITETKYPDEAQGTIRGGDERYAKFGRTVSIVDSMNAIAQSVLKSVTVVVTWKGLNGQERTVTLFGRQSRF